MYVETHRSSRRSHVDVSIECATLPGTPPGDDQGAPERKERGDPGKGVAHDRAVCVGVTRAGAVPSIGAAGGARVVPAIGAGGAHAGAHGLRFSFLMFVLRLLFFLRLLHVANEAAPVPDVIILDEQDRALRVGERQVGGVRFLHVRVRLELIALVAVLVPRVVVAVEAVLLLIPLPILLLSQPPPPVAVFAAAFRRLAVVGPARLAYLVGVHAGIPGVERAAGRGRGEGGGVRLVVLVRVVRLGGAGGVRVHPERHVASFLGLHGDVVGAGEATGLRAALGQLLSHGLHEPVIAVLPSVRVLAAVVVVLLVAVPEAVALMLKQLFEEVVVVEAHGLFVHPQELP
mmetsp:Transcript_26198/g.58684  ORF Transcript_26198/g.58684 Transcript_26198/m.58684 type:complete len:345 (-) Transcript_26198:548-1582(-)